MWITAQRPSVHINLWVKLLILIRERWKIPVLLMKTANWKFIWILLLSIKYDWSGKMAQWFKVSASKHANLSLISTNPDTSGTQVCNSSLLIATTGRARRIQTLTSSSGKRVPISKGWKERRNTLRLFWLPHWCDYTCVPIHTYHTNAHIHTQKNRKKEWQRWRWRC